MMRTLDLYLMRSIAGPTLLVAFTLMVLSSIMSLVDELENADNIGYGLAVTLQFVLMSLPAGVYDLAPTTMLLGTLLGLGTLASGSEIVVMRASGISMGRLALATAFSGGAFAVLIFVLGDWLVPLSYQTAYDLRTEWRYGGQRAPSEGGMWLREGDRYIHIEQIHAASRLGAVEEYSFHKQQRMRASLRAEAAVHTDQGWRLVDVRESRLNGQRMLASASAQRPWQVNIAPDLLELSATRPEFLTTRGLWSYAHYLNSNELDADDYWVALWRKLAVPLTAVMMSLLALPFVMGALRSTGNGQRLFIGILIGVGFYLLNEIISSSGQVYGLQPWATALLPTLVVGTIVLFWLDRLN